MIAKSSQRYFLSFDAIFPAFPSALTMVGYGAGRHLAVLSGRGQHRTRTLTMPRVMLFDLDSRVPNLALMKLSTYYKKRGFEVLLRHWPDSQKADQYLASAVFYCESTQRKIATLNAIHGADVEMGGSGIDLAKRLPPEVESCFPDYSPYNHKDYAVGFLTRGCPKRCSFCVVPAKEGPVKKNVASFSDFVPAGQRNVMLLDDNLLAFPEAESLLKEMTERQYAINFSQTLDISYLTPRVYELLLRVDYQNARFTRKRIYFSCNHPGTNRQFMDRKDMLKGFGRRGLCGVHLRVRHQSQPGLPALDDAAKTDASPLLSGILAHSGRSCAPALQIFRYGSQRSHPPDVSEQWEELGEIPALAEPPLLSHLWKILSSAGEDNLPIQRPRAHPPVS